MRVRRAGGPKVLFLKHFGALMLCGLKPIPGALMGLSWGSLGLSRGSLGLSDAGSEAFFAYSEAFFAYSETFFCIF